MANVHTITDLRPERRYPGRMIVTIDGKMALSLSLITAGRFEAGQALSEGDMKALIVEDSKHRAWQSALSYLTARPRSQAEIRRHLDAKAFSDIIIDTVVDRLERENYIDDEAFAKDWVIHRTRNNPKGRFALKIELRQKGIDEPIIDSVIAGVDDEALAMACLERKYRKRSQSWHEKDRRKAYGMLQRRGFPSDVIRESMRRFLERPAGDSSRD